MTIDINLRTARRLLLAAILLYATWLGVRAAAAATGDPLPTVAFLARADNPVDALAAAPVAGQLGAPVFLSFPDELHPDARAALIDHAPDVVVLAGGEAALSSTVFEQVQSAVPGARLIRKAGATRTATAVALAELPAELGFGRPMLTGATITGDLDLDGGLTVGGTDVMAAIAALEARVTTLETDLTAEKAKVSALQTLTTGMSRMGDTLVFEGMNVQIKNGMGTTNTTNGLGNLIIGYNEDLTCDPFGAGCEFESDFATDTRTGSHNLVIGRDHTWTSWGGILAGQDATVSAPRSSVLGGLHNTASGPGSAVVGGSDNVASGDRGAVLGGDENTAAGIAAVVAGGQRNTAQALAAILGGDLNEADGTYSSIVGGTGNTTSSFYDVVVGGSGNTASGIRSVVVGGLSNSATGDNATVSGGSSRSASGSLDWVAGTLFEDS